MKFGDNLHNSDRKNKSAQKGDKEKNGQQFNNKVHPGSKRRDRPDGAVLLNMDTARSGQSNDGEDQNLLADNENDEKKKK